MRRMIVLIVSAAACKGSSSPVANDDKSASSPSEVELAYHHPDCDRVMTREIRERFKLLGPRSNPVDPYPSPSRTDCETFQGSEDKRSVSIDFECLDIHHKRALENARRAAKDPSTITVPDLGTAAYVRGAILTVVDDDTDCELQFQAHRDGVHLEGKALLQLLGELPMVVTKQLTPAVYLSDADAALHDQDERNWDKPPKVDCDKLIDDKARAAYPGGLAWGDPIPSIGEQVKCKRLKSNDGDVEVEVRCYRLRTNAARLIETHRGNMYAPGPVYPEAAAEGMIAATTSALDTDTNCVISVFALPLTPDNVTEKTRGFMHAMLANLAPTIIGPFPKS